MPRGAKPKIYDASLVHQVRELYASGNTQQEIAAAIGISQKVVFNVMRRNDIQARVAAKREQRGEKNSYWKADAAGNAALHKRLYAMFGKPSRCSVCGTTGSKQYDYANLTGRYTDPFDFAPMCRSCHWRYDKKITNITQAKRGDADAQV